VVPKAHETAFRSDVATFRQCKLKIPSGVSAKLPLLDVANVKDDARVLLDQADELQRWTGWYVSKHTRELVNAAAAKVALIPKPAALESSDNSAEEISQQMTNLFNKTWYLRRLVNQWNNFDQREGYVEQLQSYELNLVSLWKKFGLDGYPSKRGQLGEMPEVEVSLGRGGFTILNRGVLAGSDPRIAALAVGAAIFREEKRMFPERDYGLVGRLVVLRPNNPHVSLPEELARQELEQTCMEEMITDVPKDRREMAYRVVDLHLLPHSGEIRFQLRMAPAVWVHNRGMQFRSIQRDIYVTHDAFKVYDDIVGSREY